jgi:transcriptional regulator with XRE-family HTH domain
MPETVAEIVARNLKAAMETANAGGGISQAQLAKASGVAQTTISLMLRPDDRRNPIGRGGSSPTIARIAMVARALRWQPWELLHPDPFRARREHDLFEQFRRETDANPLLTQLDPFRVHVKK